MFTPSRLVYSSVGTPEKSVPSYNNYIRGEVNGWLDKERNFVVGGVKRLF